MNMTPHEAFSLLMEMIAIPSLSRQEEKRASFIEDFIRSKGLEPSRIANNILVLSGNYRQGQPNLMLNSHIDTVPPSSSYSFDPFSPYEDSDKIYGLGSNDAGGSVVSLLSAFINLQNELLPFNLILALTAEEEVSGADGMRKLLPYLKEKHIYPDMVIVGEPTGMNPAIGERGLMVLDCKAIGKSGHAARNEGINALYKAIVDIEKLRTLKFDKTSSLLGDIKISVTMIEAGVRHNIVPDECKFVADIRTTDAYTNEETLKIISDTIESECKPRSTYIQASSISVEDPMVEIFISTDKQPFVSPTTSDMALMPGIRKIKIGPGQSSRSHTANEYIRKEEIAEAIQLYQSKILTLKELLK